jgi:hypothetical protein
MGAGASIGPASSPFGPFVEGQSMAVFGGGPNLHRWQGPEHERAVLVAMDDLADTCWEVAQVLYRRRDWQRGHRAVATAMVRLERQGLVYRLDPPGTPLELQTRLWSRTAEGEALVGRRHDRRT